VLATVVLVGAAEAFGGRPDAFAARGVFAGARGLGRYGAVFWRFAVVLMSLEEASSALRFAGTPGWKASAAGMPLPGRKTFTMLIGAIVMVY
jgi:hypothetical protein